MYALRRLFSPWELEKAMIIIFKWSHIVQVRPISSMIYQLSLIDNRLRREERRGREEREKGREVWFLVKVSIDVIALSDIYVKFIRFVIESGLILSCFDCQYVSKYNTSSLCAEYKYVLWIVCTIYDKSIYPKNG